PPPRGEHLSPGGKRPRTCGKRPRACGHARTRARARGASSGASDNGDTRVVGDEPPVKGLGIAKGARRPGKR
ncbi:hypothetical protein, partial [Mycolicibacterium vanbaalenii]|uniref:hypothetical protein n=1 Tax=Mycolicibacterium vanbaalenii TaxID=110539 RepID=UPI0021F28A46